MNSAARLGFSSSRGDHDSDSLLKGALALSRPLYTTKRLVDELFMHYFPTGAPSPDFAGGLSYQDV